MRIEIDQSGKIENTNKSTVLAFSNSKNKSIIIFPTDKKKIQNYYRKIGQPTIFVYKLFAMAVYELIKKDLNQIN